MRVAYAV